MAEPTYAIRDLGAERVVLVGGTEYRTYYSERVVRMLIARKGPRCTPLYFAFKESRGRHFLEAGARRNASWAECLPSAGAGGLTDVTEEAGYGWRFFRDTARSRTRRAVLPAFAAAASALRLAGRPPSLALPYFNVIFRKLDGAR